MHTIDGIPDMTLGWGVLEWCTNHLGHPDGEHMGDPWIFSPEQARFVLWFYAVDKTGRFCYRRALLARCKGWGKSPLIAALCCVELLGPVRFSHFEQPGIPVGRSVPSPMVQVVAVSAAQTDNTFSLIREMLKLGDAESVYGLEVGRSRILSDGGRLEPVTANARSREGQRVTFSVFDESHLWVDGNRGKALADVVRRNAAKMDARTVETTNAPMPGEGSVAEDSYGFYERIASGEIKDPGFLFDNRQAPDSAPLLPGPERRAALVEAYGDACKENGGWVDLDRIEMEIDDPATSPADARRFYYNQLCKGSSSWLDKERFSLGSRRMKVALSEPISLGFDGSIRNDSTALVGCRLSDGFLWPIGVWENPGGEIGKDWEVPFLEVDQLVRATLDKHDVRWMYADPAYWQDIVGKWSADYPDTVYEFWTHRKSAMASAIERFESAVLRRELIWSGDPAHEVLPRHVGNAHVLVTPAGKLIRKESPKTVRKIDAAMAAVLAYEARGAAIQDGRLVADDNDNSIYSF